MKKIKKLITIMMAMIMSVSAFSLVACRKDSGIDPDKIQVYVYTTSDGYGHQYMEKLVDNFNASHVDTEYQFVWVYGTDGYKHIPDELESGVCSDKNIYVGSNTRILDYIKQEYVIDISDVYEMEVDGVKIKDKVLNYEELKEGYSDWNGNGMYAVPHGYSLASSMVFDFEHFLRRGYLNYAKESELSAVNAQVADAVEVKSGTTLDANKYAKVNENVLVAKVAFGNYEVGDVILTAGRDSKYGTYDDGQVNTVDEFYDLLRRITVRDYAYIYTTQYAGTIYPFLFPTLLYQNMGYENTKTFLSFNGDIKNADGSIAMSGVNYDNANQMWDTQVAKNAFDQAADFLYNAYCGRYLGKENISKMLNIRTFNNGPTSSLSHTDAQRGFALDHYDRGDDSGKETAFLLDGVWWENESQTVLKQLGGYGADATEHRIYLTPIMEGQVGPEDETVIVGAAGSNMTIYLNNYPKEVKTDEQKRAYDAICKEFIAYTCSDEALNWYTERHGLKACFDYELSEQTLASITPFQKNYIEMVEDTEHIKVVDSVVSGEVKNVMRAILDIRDFEVRAGEATLQNYYALNGLTPRMQPSEYYEGVRLYINSNYAKKLSSAKEYIATFK